MRMNLNRSRHLEDAVEQWDLLDGKVPLSPPGLQEGDYFSLDSLEGTVGIEHARGLIEAERRSAEDLARAFRFLGTTVVHNPSQ